MEEAKGVIHEGTLRASLSLFVLFLLLSIILWLDMPDRYPIRFGLSGEPTGWAEGPGMWILLVAICSLSFGQGALFQRFLVTDPDSPLLNVPYRDRFRELPRARRVPVVRRANRILGLCNLGLVVTFLLLLFLIYHAARNPGSLAVQVSQWSLWVVVALLVVVPLGEAWLLREMVRRKLIEEGLLN